jgi:tripartite-type tricarboxylate transporter receptor subunit TctC
MKRPRRRFLHLAAGAAVLPAVSRVALAQAYPARPVRMIVPFGPAGTTDTVARLMAQWLSERLGQTFVVENRPGAGTNIATEAVVKAQPDGYTLLLVPPEAAINATFYDKLNFIFIRDIAPVASIIRTPLVMVVNPSVPAKTIREFITYAKADPGKINIASAGNGTGSHMAGELFKMMTSIVMNHVAYRGMAPAVSSLIDGQVQVMFSTIAAAIQYIKAGNLRALAVTTATQSPTLPGIPTVAEFVPGYEASSWYGVGAPMNIPVEIVDKLNKLINAALSDPNMKARFADLGGTVLPGSPAEFGKLLTEEVERWGKVIRAGNIKAQ